MTLLLQRIGTGQRAAVDELFPLVYAELRRKAERYMSAERPGHTLQATALVHDALVKMVDRADASAFENRKHFYYTAALAMRRLLLERARKRVRREENLPRRNAEDLGELVVAHDDQTLDFEALDAALKKLEAMDARRHRVVMLRYFAGLDEEQVAADLNVTVRTVRRDWATAKLFLSAELASATG